MRVRFLRAACPACWLLDVSRLIASRMVFRAQGESPAPRSWKRRATCSRRVVRRVCSELIMLYRKLTILDFEPPLAATAESTRDDAVTARGGRGHRVLRRGHRRGHRATARGHRGHRPREPCEGDAVTAGGRTRSPRPPPAVTARGYRAAAPLRHIIGKRSHLPPFQYFCTFFAALKSG